jgi:hypothetical protein
MEARRGWRLRPNGYHPLVNRKRTEKGSVPGPMHVPQGRLTIGKVEPIEVMMEFLFDSLSALEFHPCLRDGQGSREKRFGNANVSWSATVSCFSPATANAATKVSSSGGLASLPVASFNNSRCRLAQSLGGLITPVSACQNPRRTLQCGRERCIFLGDQPEAEVSIARHCRGFKGGL